MCFNDKPWKRCTAFRYIAHSKHPSTHIQRDILLQSFFSSTYILIFVALASLVSSLPFNIFRVILSPPLLYLEFLTSCCRRGIRANMSPCTQFFFLFIPLSLSPSLLLFSPFPSSVLFSAIIHQQ